MTRAPTVPLDIAAVVAYVVVAVPLLLSGVVAGPLRVVLGAPLVALLPGYALLAVLFPGRRLVEDGDGVDRAAALRSRGVSWPERLALSVGATLALVPLLAIVLSVARIPLTPVPIVVGLAFATVLATAVGALRRWQLPPDERVAVPVDRWHREVRAGLGAGGLDAALNVALALAVVAALAGVGYALAAPPQGESYTDMALLTPQGDALVAGNYTTEFVSGERADLTVTVENQEGTQTTYTLVGVLERVRVDNGTATVLERQRLSRQRLTVADGATARRDQVVAPTMLGDRLRLSYYLYVGDAPQRVGPSTADEHLFLWVTVHPPGAASGSTTTQTTAQTTTQTTATTTATSATTTQATTTTASGTSGA